MKKQFLLLAGLGGLLVGCTSTKMIRNFDEFNTIAQGREGRVVLADGQKFDGYDIHTSPDATTWKYSKRGLTTHSIATSEIQEIVFKNWVKGSLRGLSIGALFGAPMGVIASNDSDDLPNSPVLAAISLAALYGGTGALVGGAIGTKDKFIFAEPAMQTEPIASQKQEPTSSSRTPATEKPTINVTDKLAEAEKSYREGNLDLTLDILSDVVKMKNIATEDKIEAYQLLCKTHLANNNFEQAEKSLDRLLALKPDYQPDPDLDPPSFVKFVRHVQKARQ